MASMASSRRKSLPGPASPPDWVDWYAISVGFSSPEPPVPTSVWVMNSDSMSSIAFVIISPRNAGLSVVMTPMW